MNLSVTRPVTPVIPPPATHKISEPLSPLFEAEPTTPYYIPSSPTLASGPATKPASLQGAIIDPASHDQSAPLSPLFDQRPSNIDRGSPHSSPGSSYDYTPTSLRKANSLISAGSILDPGSVKERDGIEKMPEDKPISNLTLACYLKQLSEADNQKVSTSSFGLLVLASSIASVAFLALENNRMSDELGKCKILSNTLQGKIYEYKNTLLALQNTRKSQEECFKATKLLQKLYQGTNGLSELYEKIKDLFYQFLPGTRHTQEPSQACLKGIAECVNIPYYGIDKQNLGSQERCLVDNSNDTQLSIHLSIKPSKIEPNSGTSPLYNQGVVQCESSKNITKLFDDYVICTGWFKTNLNYTTPYKGAPTMDLMKQKVIHYSDTAQSTKNLGKLEDFIRTGLGL